MRKPVGHEEDRTDNSLRAARLAALTACFPAAAKFKIERALSLTAVVYACSIARNSLALPVGKIYIFASAHVRSNVSLSE